LDLRGFGDPRVNVNSIVSLTPGWVERLLERIGVTSIEQLPVPFTALTLRNIQEELLRENLFFPDVLIQQVLAALRSGKHVMLTGAPGTVKTSLALVVANAASHAGLAEEPLLTTATADWTSADTVGAYRITKAQTLEFEAGHFVSAVTASRWLVIDELNRSDIDKAIGQLFTVLSGQSVVLPFKEHAEEEESSISIVPWGASVPEGTSPRQVGRNWRLVATLNDRDRDLLFDMSEALMRRFAIIEVPAPTAAQWASILGPHASTGVPAWDAALKQLVTSAAFSLRPLGAAVVLDCAKHLREVQRLEIEVGEESNRRVAFESAFRLYIAPQLSTSSLDQDADVASLIQAAWPTSAATRPNDS
jgi:MoxR-like ATPase